MSLSQEERQVMVELELERAQKILAQVPSFVENEFWDTLANRLYYACFHAVSALLIRHEIPVNSHKGAIMMFNRDFIRTEKFAKEYGQFFSQLEGLRERGDYNCYIETSKEEILPYVYRSKEFVESIANYLGSLEGNTVAS